jgi:hypothetical protein
MIESVLPSQAARNYAAAPRDSRFSRASALTAVFVVLVPLLALAAFQFTLWFFEVWVEMAETAPLLLAQ